MYIYGVQNDVLKSAYVMDQLKLAKDHTPYFMHLAFQAGGARSFQHT
jgi:hypothetical protein